MDNGCREFLFVNEFFNLTHSTAQEYFEEIFGKTLQHLSVSTLSTTVHVSIHPTFQLIHTPVYFSNLIHLSIHLFIHLFIHPFIHYFKCWSFYLTIYYSFIHSFIYSSMYSSILLSIYLFVYLSIPLPNHLFLHQSIIHMFYYSSIQPFIIYPSTKRKI